MTELTDQLANLMTTRLGVPEEELRDNASFEDLQVDSLIIVELLLIIKKEYGVLLREGEITPDFTLPRIVDLLQSKGVTA